MVKVVREKRNWKSLVWGIGAFCMVMCAGAATDCRAEAFEAEERVTVVDDAGLLMEEEVDWLKETAVEFTEKSDWNIIVATCDDAAGNTAQTVCEDYFNAYTTGDDGISCLIDMDNREIYIATAGEAQLYLNDARIDTILDTAFEAVADGDYSECLYLMLVKSSEAYDRGIPENAQIYDVDTGKTTVYKQLTLMEILFALLAALAVGGIVFGSIVGKYRLKWGLYAYDFHDSGSLTLEREEDRFIHQTVTHRRIPRNNGGGPSGGGGSRSTVHTGSGGRSFGGGGRKF